MGTRARIALTLAAVFTAAAACSSPGPSGSDGSVGAARATPGAPGGSAAALDCGGKVHDLASALRLITDPPGCPGAVNTLWRRTSGVGDRWTSPRFIAYHDGQVPDDACGRAAPDPNDFASNAAYCPSDDTVVYSVELLERLYRGGGAYQPVLVLDHELGHRADRLAGAVGVVSRAEENQADCAAGYAVRFAYDAKRLPVSNVFGGGILFFSLGDRGGSWFTTENPAAPGVHGTPTQRASAYLAGFLHGAKRCRQIGRSSSGTVGVP